MVTTNPAYFADTAVLVDEDGGGAHRATFRPFQNVVVLDNGTPYNNTPRFCAPCSLRSRATSVCSASIANRSSSRRVARSNTSLAAIRIASHVAWASRILWVRFADRFAAPCARCRLVRTAWFFRALASSTCKSARFCFSFRTRL